MKYTWPSDMLIICCMNDSMDKSSFLLEDGFPDEFLELNSSIFEGPDSSREQVSRHLALVHLVPETFLACVDVLNVEFGGLFFVESERDLSLTLLHLVEQSRGNCQSVDSAKVLDLVSVPERSPHNDGLDVVGAIVVENVCNEDHSGVLERVLISLSELLLVPVQDSSDEGGNQEKFAVCTSHCLDKMENQSHVDLNVAFGQDFCCFDSFPGGGNFNQNSVRADSSLLVKGDDSLGPSHGFIFVETEGGINLGRHVAFDPFEDFTAKGHTDMVKDQSDELFFLCFAEFFPFDCLALSSFVLATAVLIKILESKINGVIEDALELRSFGDLVDEGGIGS